MKKSMFCGGVLASCLIASAYANNLTFQGNLIIPNCTVNNNQQFTIDWNDVEIQTFDSPNVAYHIKQVSIPLDCPYYYNTPKLTLSGGSGNYIQTSKHDEGLVISVRQGAWSNDKPVPLGQKTNIVSDAISGTGRNKTLNLGFALARTKKIEDLTPGRFTASANLEVRYE